MCHIYNIANSYLQILVFSWQNSVNGMYCRSEFNQNLIF